MADVLSQGMHDGLVQVLDDAVVGAVDMDADLGGSPSGAPVEAGDGYGSQPRSRAQVSARTIFSERPDEETARSTSPGSDWD